ncbi:MAG: YabP/YqfC family sporulation protein [Bacilli bacterium]|nr:YabP/YqfC family sporulation protein [Bacilli bacterium]
MDILSSIKNYINDNKNTITILNNYIYVSNYKNIKSFGSNKFSIEVDDKLINLIGKNITVKKLTKEEILIGGNITDIEFR